MRQYFAAKEQYPDCLMFCRIGDFYELFYEDAILVSRLLQLTLTARDREKKQPMCGVPYHAAETYVQRLLRMGLCDAVICAGADTLCRLVTNGFHALEATASGRCAPFSRSRQGINIGEAAAVFLMTREHAPVAFLGGGASSDAYHMSSPAPDGRGASEAMRRALSAAGIDAATIDYVNLHGTATEHNDAMESHAMADTFARPVPCSSTKALTGHTLGAAGALEAAFCWMTLVDARRRLPPHVWDGEADPRLPALALTRIGDMLPAGRRVLMTNSFAFGGNNASLILANAA